MKKALFTLSTMLASVSLALAQFGGSITIGTSANQGAVNGGALLQLLALAQTIVARLVPFLIGLAVLAFFWFLIEFLWKGSKEAAKREEGMKGMMYSLLALFVMVSIWGIVGFLGSMLGIGQGGTTPIPGVPVPAY